MPTTIKLINDSELGQVTQITTTKGDTLGYFDSPGITFTMKDVDSQGVETPIDLTGSSILVQLRSSSAQVNSSLQFSSDDSSIDITDLASGKFTLHKSASEMNDLDAGEYIFDIQVTKDGNVTTLTRGRWIHNGDITY